MSFIFQIKIEPVVIEVEDMVDGEPTGYTKAYAREIALERFSDMLNSGELGNSIDFYIEDVL